MKGQFLKTTISVIIALVLTAAISSVVFAADTAVSTSTGEVRYFTVQVNKDQKTLPAQWPDPSYDTTNLSSIECVLKLPTNYSETGDPVPLIMRCHGVGGYVTSTSWQGGDMSQFTTNGYAVFDVDNLLNINGTVKDVGAPALVRAFMKAYDHIVENYNVQEKMIAIGVSYGSYPALEIMDYYPEYVRAGVIGGPRTSLEYAWQTGPQHIANVYDFSDKTGATYDTKVGALYCYYDNIKMVDGKRYIDKKIPPTLWVFGLKEKSEDPTCWYRGIHVVEGLTNAGNSVTYREYELGHSGVCSFLDETTGLKSDTLAWLSNYKDLTCTHQGTTVIDAAVAATCTKTGLTEGKHCTSCGAVMIKQQVTAKIDHNKVAVPAVAATCEATGLTEGTVCGSCGKVFVRQQATPLVGHSYDSNKTCTVCGYVNTNVYGADAVRADKQQIVINIDSYIPAQEINSVLAFASASSTATIADAFANPDDVLAVELGATVETINISASRIAAGKNYLIIYYGATDGRTKKTVVPLNAVSSMEIQLGNPLDVVKELEIDGVTYTNLIAVTYTMSANDILKYRTLGASFKMVGSSYSNPMAVDFGSKFSGEGQYNIVVGFAGVPSSDIDEDFTASPIFQAYVGGAAVEVN